MRRLRIVGLDSNTNDRDGHERQSWKHSFKPSLAESIFRHLMNGTLIDCFYTLLIEREDVFMKPISALSHGVLDYLVGIALLGSPWLFGFHLTSDNATYTMVAMGLVVLLLSMCTNYPLGMIRSVSFPLHGKIETAGAVVLLVSPWLVHFSDIATARNLAIVVSLVWLAVVALTNYTTFSYRRPIH